MGSRIKPCLPIGWQSWRDGRRSGVSGWATGFQKATWDAVNTIMTNNASENRCAASAQQLISYIAVLLYRVSPGSNTWTYKVVQELNGCHPKCPAVGPRQVALAMISVAEQRGDQEIVDRLMPIARARGLSWSSLAAFGGSLAQEQIDNWATIIHSLILDCRQARNTKDWLESIRREAVVRHCDLCWRSAIWFKRGAALCSRHIPSSAREDGSAGDYKAAVRMRRVFQSKLQAMRREYRAERWSTRRSRFQSAAKLLSRFPETRKMIGSACTFRELIGKLDTQDLSACSVELRETVEPLLNKLHKMVEEHPEMITATLIRAEAWCRAKDLRRHAKSPGGRHPVSAAAIVAHARRRGASGIKKSSR